MFSQFYRRVSKISLKDTPAHRKILAAVALKYSFDPPAGTGGALLTFAQHGISGICFAGLTSLLTAAGTHRIGLVILKQALRENELLIRLEQTLLETCHFGALPGDGEIGAP
jgi:hypothetical protein